MKKIILGHKFNFLILSVFFILFLFFIHPIPMQGPNVDLGHHLLLGKIITETQQVPDTNLISYTNPDYEYVNSRWLSEVIFYGSQNLFGFTSLIILGLILICLSFYFILATEKKSLSILSLTISSLIYLQMIINRTEIKPELFSYLIFSIFIFILYKFRNKYTKLIFLLIPLQALWVNLHIFFFTGIAILFIFLIDEVFTSKYNLKSKKIKTLFLVTVLASIATLLNPQFLKGAVYPLFVLNNYGYRVIENLNTFSAFKLYPDITFIYFFSCVVILWTGIIIFKNQIKLVDILLSAFFTFLAFFAVRNFPLFILGTFIPFTRILDLSFDYIIKHFKLNKDTFEIILFGITLMIVVPTIIWGVNLHGLGIGVKDNSNAATTFFKQNNIKGPIYNNYNIGNYLEFKLFPNEKVFINGNPEEYPKEFFRDIYNPSEISYAGFKKADKIYKFNSIFYEHKNQTQNQNPLLRGIINDKKWKMVFLSSSIVIFLKDSPSNLELIKKYEINQNNINHNNYYNLSKNEIGDLSNFFRVIGWYIPMYQMDLKYLDFDPNNCTALRHVAIIMRQQNSPLADTYINKYQNFCK